MRLKAGLSFLLLGAGVLVVAGCGAHGSSSVVPGGSSPATSSVHVGFRTVVHQTTVTPGNSSTAMSVQAAGTVYIGTVATIPALLQNPTGLTYDPDDKNIYVVDRSSQNQSEVLRVNGAGATSILATLPGNGSHIVYDQATRSFYVTTGSGGLAPGSFTPGVYQVTSSGTVSTLAGGNGSSIIDGTGSAAGFNDPTGITVDPVGGSIYVMDDDRLRSISAAGVVKTITAAGAIGGGGCCGNGYGITFNAKDANLYVTSGSNQIVRKVTTAGQISNFAGACIQAQFSNCFGLERDGTGASALFDGPESLAADPSTGFLYIADTNNEAIRKITGTARVTVLAGSGLQIDTNGIGRAAAFASPAEVAMGNGKIYVLDLNNQNNSHSLRSVVVHGTVAPPAPEKITFFQTPSLYPNLGAIASTTSSIWFSEQGVNGGNGRIGKISAIGVATEYPVSNSPDAVAIGSDGTAWFAASNSNQQKIVGHISSGGQATEWTIPNTTTGFSNNGLRRSLALGPDGNMWFVFSSSVGPGATATFGNITAAGTITQHSIPAPNGFSFQPNLTFTADGNAWLSDGNVALEVNNSGTILNTFNYPISAATRGQDGYLWFTQTQNETAVGTVHTNPNVIELFPIIAPVQDCQYSQCYRFLNDITLGPDNNLWMPETFNGGFPSIASMTTSGAFTEYVIPAAHSNPSWITSGPGGNVWFIDSGAQKIGVMRLH